ncbi:MAG TPA: beta-ketoacyl synthase N-terminal-like domain-containing protein, partial [Vicinamibacteria bacterium]|nr:beta-ketoacyl synthase N-terminal-like domain-containing protein [Vicinamibacteria bacterium]
MRSSDVVILAGARTPMAECVGSFKDVSALELGGHAAREALSRAGLPADAVDHVVMGNALQTSGDAIYGARHVGLKAGVPVTTPALTVNRLCGSGIQSVVSAAQMIRLGEARVALAGGMENMSQAPHVIRGARSGFRLGEGKLEDSLMVALLDTHCGLYMAQTSDNLARQHGITREAMDAYALQTQQRAARATERGVFAEEIVPVDVVQGRKTVRVEVDDHPRPDTTLEGLAA